MSIVSAIFSSRRSSSRINARTAFFMDNLFAIAFGLGLRFVVDNVSNHDFKLTGTLVGLWEGVITLHFLKKTPNSIDPYIAYVVRLFVDFLVTENIVRLVLVVVWTGLGMVLADIAPAIWHDVGGHRVWRRFRRDIYYMSRSVPTVTIPPLFPRARVVRFSPVIQPTEISETLSTLSPTAATPTVTSQAPATQIVPPTPPDGPVRTRRVPGGNVSVFSETNSDGGSVVGSQPPASVRSVGTSHVQYTIRPRRDSIDESVSQAPSNSVDDSNLSSDASSVSTETPSQPIGLVEEEEEEIDIPVRKLDKGKGKAVDIDTSGAPAQPPFTLPPTPSDSNRPHFEVSRNSFVPTITGMPSIPDFYESGLGSDWENIRKEEVEEAMMPPTPPEKDFDSKIYDSPPAHFIPPPASSVYEPTPRPSTFDKDLWDDVSNAASSTPYAKLTSEQRTSRLPQPSTSTLQAPEARVSQPVKKRKSEPPPVPQTPIYGDAWDTERDQIPPQTPSVLATTPMYDHTVDLNEPIYPASEPLAPAAEQEQGPAEPTGLASEQQGHVDFSFGTDDPRNNPTPPVQLQDQQQQSTAPQTPQTRHAGPPTPRVPTQTPPTPQQRSGTVPPTPSHRPGTVPPTPHHPLQPIPPTPLQEQLQPAQPTPGQASRTVPSTPRQKPQTVPSTPQTKAQTVAPTLQQQPQSTVPTSQQQPQSVPPTSQQQPQPVPHTPGQKTRTVPPTSLYKTQTTPGTPQQQTQAVPPTPDQKSKTVPSTPLHRAQTVPPTPVNKARSALPTPQRKSLTLPPDSPPPQLKPVPPEPIPRTPLEQTKDVPPTPQPPAKTASSTPQQTKTVPPTPQSRTKTIPPTPQQQKTSLPTPQTPRSRNQNLFDDFVWADIGEGLNHELRDFTSQQQQPEGDLLDFTTQQPEGDLLGLGSGETGGNEGKNLSKGEGEGTGGDGGEDNNNNNNNGNKNENGNGNENRNGEGDAEAEADNAGDEAQVDEHNNPMSPVSSAYSSVAGVATEIKERNKQAIIIRAQIHELTKRIEDLKDEKLKAEGREELDPLSEESTLKEQEIQKAERSLEKMKRRAEKRHQAAVESTNQLTIPKTLALNFETSSSADAALRLEDILGLMFGPERKSFKLEISLPKGGPGKPVKAAVQRVLSEYGIKSISKLSALNVTVMSKAYIDMITTFRQNNSKEADDS